MPLLKKGDEPYALITWKIMPNGYSESSYVRLENYEMTQMLRRK